MSPAVFVTRSRSFAEETFFNRPDTVCQFALELELRQSPGRRRKRFPRLRAGQRPGDDMAGDPGQRPAYLHAQSNYPGLRQLLGSGVYLTRQLHRLPADKQISKMSCSRHSCLFLNVRCQPANSLTARSARQLVAFITQTAPGTAYLRRRNYRFR
jgi:hypothetical protein